MERDTRGSSPVSPREVSVTLLDRVNHRPQLPPRRTDSQPRSLLSPLSAQASRTTGAGVVPSGPTPWPDGRRRHAERSRSNEGSPRRGPVENAQLFFARRKAALARRRERAARVGPNGVNRAAIVPTEVLAAFVLSKDQHQLSVVAPGKGRTCEVSPSSVLEASDVALFEFDPVVLAAGAAGQAIELDLSSGALVNRIPLRPLAYDPVGIVRNAEVGQACEGPAARGDISRASQVEDGPPSEVALVARSRPRKDEPGLARGKPDERMATGPNPLGRLLPVGPAVGSYDRTNEEHSRCSNTASSRTRGSRPHARSRDS